MFSLISFGTGKCVCVMNTKEMFSLLPLINNSLTTEWGFWSLIISTIFVPDSKPAIFSYLREGFGIWGTFGLCVIAFFPVTSSKLIISYTFFLLMST